MMRMTLVFIVLFAVAGGGFAAEPDVAKPTRETVQVKPAAPGGDMKDRKLEMSKRMNDLRRLLGTARIAVSRKKDELEKSQPECVALAAEIAALKAQLKEKEAALSAVLEADKEYAGLTDAVKQVEDKLDAARKDLFMMVQEEKLRTQPGAEGKSSVLLQPQPLN